jgi:protease-4
MTLETYDLFVSRVASGRKLSIDSTKMIAQGRVWTGKKALEIGLVDTLGDLNDAIAIAAKKAGLEKYKIVEYPYIEEDIMATIIREIQKSKGDEEDAVRMLAGKEEYKWFNQYRQFKSIIRCREPHARLPFILSLN